VPVVRARDGGVLGFVDEVARADEAPLGPAKDEEFDGPEMATGGADEPL
jgi:hypothetical protein